MGFTPAEVGAMSLWEFFACEQGWRKANSSKPSAPTGDELDDAFAAHAAMDAGL